jgi:hypothetical protein
MRFCGQIVASAMEKGNINTLAELKAWTNGAYEAIKFAKSWGATAPVPATPSQANATPAGSPPQTPQGGTRVRPTGNFGYGTKQKDTPWNTMPTRDLTWWKDESKAPADVKAKCADELWFREEDQKKSKAILDSQVVPRDADFDDQDIPF